MTYTDLYKQRQQHVQYAVRDQTWLKTNMV